MLYHATETYECECGAFVSVDDDDHDFDCEARSMCCGAIIDQDYRICPDCRDHC